MDMDELRTKAETVADLQRAKIDALEKAKIAENDLAGIERRLVNAQNELHHATEALVTEAGGMTSHQMYLQHG